MSAVLQNTTDGGFFQTFKFNYVETAKIAICNNAVIWIDEIIGRIKSLFKDDSHKDIIQAAYVRFWTPRLWWKKHQRETEHDRAWERSDNDNEEQLMITTTNTVTMATRIIITGLLQFGLWHVVDKMQVLNEY